MKKTLKTLIVFILVATLTTMSPVYASSIPNIDENDIVLPLVSADEFVGKVVSDAIRYREDCEWNETTVVTLKRPLYDLDYNLNGYIYTLSTNNQPSGYIEILYFDGVFSEKAQSFYGTDHIQTWLSEFVLTEQSKNCDLDKIIYTGYMEYWVKTYDGEYIYSIINGNGTTADNFEPIRDAYESRIQRRRAELEMSVMGE